VLIGPQSAGPKAEGPAIVTKEQDQDRDRRARAQQVGLFRYGLIQDALDPALSTKQRGPAGPRGRRRHPPGAVRGAGAGLPGQLGPVDPGLPRRRVHRAGARAAAGRGADPASVLELAVALKTERPDRTAAQVAVVLAAHGAFTPSARTLQRHFAAAGFTRARPEAAPLAVFGRFEAERPNARWVGDALHGPVVAGRKAILIAFLDDHSRTVVAARWGHAENAVALRETLRAALAARGRPAQTYVDNGAMFIDAGLRRACAVLGIKLTHSAPGRPAGRGKIERFFRTVRDQFLVEIATGADGVGSPVDTLAELNSLFTAWVEQVYHQRVHSETGQSPLARFLAAGPPVPTPAALLAEAFRWGEWRTVTKTATVSLHGNLYEVDPKAAADTPPPATPTGIDYLRLLEDRHTRAMGERLRYAQLADPTHPQRTGRSVRADRPGHRTAR
jgi:putative transposase